LTTKIKIPADCHLWNNKELSKNDLYKSLEVIKVYDDDSHQTRSLKQCTKCGQLYFYEFKEFIDWEKGNDAQYQTWIPVDNKGVAKELARENSATLLLYPAIRVDFPSDAKKPSKPYLFNQNVIDQLKNKRVKEDNERSKDAEDKNNQNTKRD